jgi:hypothetical protein
VSKLLYERQLASRGVDYLLSEPSQCGRQSAPVHILAASPLPRTIMIPGNVTHPDAALTHQDGAMHSSSMTRWGHQTTLAGRPSLIGQKPNYGLLKCRPVSGHSQCGVSTE